MSHALVVNDMAEARRELAGQYGDHPNAEELIRAHAASISPEVRSAQLKPLNEEATRTLDRSTIDVPEGGKLVDAVVRSNVISYVWEDSLGRWHRGVQGYDDSYEPPSEAEAERLMRATAMHDVAEREKALDLRAEMQLAIKEQVEKLQGEHAEALEKLREEHSKEMESLRKEVEKAEKPSRSSGRSRSRSKGGTSRKKSSVSRRKSGSSRSQKQMEQQQAERKVGEG